MSFNVDFHTKAGASALFPSLPGHAPAWPDGGGYGVESARAAGANSGEAAGLVPLKTSPHENSSDTGSLYVGFDRDTQNDNRIKRLRHKVWLAGYLHNMVRPGHRGDQPWFITLTYDTQGTLGRGSFTWHKDQMSKVTELYRRWCVRHGLPCRYTWVAELQQSGTVHYHVIAWLPRGVRMPKWDQPTTHRGRTCQPFWPYGMSNRQQAKSGVAYLMKYLSKMGKYHEFPKGCRTHSTAGLDSHGRLVREWSGLPQWVKNLYGVGEIGRCHGRLVEMATGKPLEPLYRREFVREKGKVVGIMLTPLRAVPERCHDGPYSRIYTNLE